ncbi:peptidase S8/S53 domain-containing protein [Trichoderma compactum]
MLPSSFIQNKDCKAALTARMNYIKINGDFRSAASAMGIMSSTAFAQPPPAKQALRDKEVDLLDYKGDDVYLCGYKPSTLDPVNSSLGDFVTNTEVYHPDYVVEPKLKAGNSEEVANVAVILHDDVGNDNLESVASNIAAQAGISAGSVEIHDRKARIKVPKSKLPQLARIDEVKAINQVQARHLFNNVAGGILEANKPVGKVQATYKGKGQIVCVADTGFDTGSKDHYHEAFGDRVLSLHNRGRSLSSRWPAPADDPDGHGTHVCGSALGNGIHAEEGRIEAPASEAKLIMQSVFDKWYKRWDDDPPAKWEAALGGIGRSYRDLFDGVFQEGARIHSNSWGGSPAPYDEAESGQIDGYLWENKALTVLFAAGNSAVDVDANHGHVDPGSLCSQSVCKNVISVGASENNRPGVEYPLEGGKPLVYGAWPDDFP